MQAAVSVRRSANKSLPTATAEHRLAIVASAWLDLDHAKVVAQDPDFRGDLDAAKRHATKLARSLAKRHETAVDVQVLDLETNTPAFSTTYNPGDTWTNVRRAIARVDPPRPRQDGLRHCTKQQAREALDEIANLIALVGMCRPIDCVMVDPILDAIEKACGRKGGA